VTEVLYPNSYAATGGPGPAVALSVVKARATWQMLDPEFARRLEAFMVAMGGKIGLGQGGRPPGQQEQLFRSRYYIDDVHGTVVWNGHRWAKLPGVASAAPPGRSYHEDTTPDGKALAADMVGDVTLLAKYGPAYGLIEFGKVNGEPWHAQPLELPHARADYIAAHMHPLAPWILPGTPTDPPEGDEMPTARLVRNKGFANVFLVGAGPALALSGELYASYSSQEQAIPKVFQDHRPSLIAMCFQSGLDPNNPAELVPGGREDQFE